MASAARPRSSGPRSRPLAGSDPPAHAARAAAAASVVEPSRRQRLREADARDVADGRIAPEVGGDDRWRGTADCRTPAHPPPPAAAASRSASRDARAGTRHSFRTAATCFCVSDRHWLIAIASACCDWTLSLLRICVARLPAELFLRDARRDRGGRHAGYQQRGLDDGWDHGGQDRARAFRICPASLNDERALSGAFRWQRIVARCFPARSPHWSRRSPRTAALPKAPYRELIEWQIAEGSAGLVPCGTTGEAATMSGG